MHTYIYIHAHIHTYIHMYVCIYVFMMYVCMYESIHVFIYVYIYTYVYIHMYVICVYNNIVHFLAPPRANTCPAAIQCRLTVSYSLQVNLACICFMYQPKVLKILLHWSHTNDRPSSISSQVLCPCTLVSSLSDRAINPVGIIHGMEIVPVGLYVKPGRDNTQNTPAKTCINPVGTRPNY